MPGLVGIIDLDRKCDIEKQIGKMTNAIKHEEWHTIQIYVNPDKTVALGRVSTGILNPKPQPIFNEDRSLAIIMEGEIFDYEDFKNDHISKGHCFTINNDPEFALHLYEEFGEDFVKRLNGFFTAVVWDRPRQRLIIANDRYGYRPLYWAHVNNKLLICSEIKGILQDRTFRREVNQQGVAEFLAFGHLLGENTLFKDVHLLPAASLWVYQNQTFSKRQYWSPDQHMEVDTRPRKEYLEEIAFLFKRGVQRQLKGDHNITVSLTGGLDSRAIIATINSSSPRIYSFLHGIKGCTDEKLAQKVADETTGERHRFYELGSDFLSNFPQYASQTVYLSDGMCKLSLAQVLFSREKLRQYAQIELNASGADIAWGFGIYPYILYSKSDDELVANCLKKYKIHFDEVRLFTHAYYQNIEGQASEALQQILSNTRSGLSLSGKANCFYLQEHARKLFMNSWVLAGNYIEYRAPYSDNDLIDLLLKAPLSLLNEDRRIAKFIIQENNPVLARIPLELSNLAVPFNESKIHRRAIRYSKEVIEGKSRKYLPPRLSRVLAFSRPYLDYDHWMRNELRPFVEGILLDQRTFDRGYYNQEYVRQMLTSHMSGKENLSSQLEIMLGFELWHRLFLD